MEPFRRLEAVAVPMPEPNIDTDRIIPARFLSRLRGVDHAPFLFHDARRLPGSEDEDPAFPLNRPEWRGASIVVAGRNFACGSSREAAVWEFEVEGEELLALPAAQVHAIRIARAPAGPYDLRVALWLAPGADYAPVRLCLTTAAGDRVDLQWSGTTNAEAPPRLP